MSAFTCKAHHLAIPIAHPFRFFEFPPATLVKLSSILCVEHGNYCVHRWAKSKVIKRRPIYLSPLILSDDYR